MSVAVKKGVTGASAAPLAEQETAPPASADQPLTLREISEWREAVLASPLSHATARVALRIAEHLNIKTGRCDPSMATISRGSNVSEEAVRTAIRQLSEGGWIVRMENRGRRRGGFRMLRNPQLAGGFSMSHGEREIPQSGRTKSPNLTAEIPQPVGGLLNREEQRTNREGQRPQGAAPSLNDKKIGGSDTALEAPIAHRPEGRADSAGHGDNVRRIILRVDRVSDEDRAAAREAMWDHIDDTAAIVEMIADPAIAAGTRWELIRQLHHDSVIAKQADEEDDDADEEPDWGPHDYDPFGRDERCDDED